MKIKKLLLAAFFLSMSIGAFSYVSYEQRHPVVSTTCLQNCADQGYPDGYCLKTCSF